MTPPDTRGGLRLKLDPVVPVPGGRDAGRPGGEGRPRTDDPAPVGRRLGDLVLAARLVTEDQLTQAITEQKRTGEKLGAVLVRLGLITEDQFVHLLSHHYRVPVVTLPQPKIAPDLLKLVPLAVAQKYEVMPVGRRGPAALILAMTDPSNLSALDDIAFRTGLKVIPVIAAPSDIRRAIEQSYAVDMSSHLVNALSEAEAEAGRAIGTAPLDPQELKSSADQVPVVRLVNTILLHAIQRGASDVHLEPDEDGFHVRLRVDGMLQDVMKPPRHLEPAVVSRIKIMANLDISERRLPQDGRIKFREGEREIDFRVSVIPAIFGESVVLRLLDKQALKLDLTQLGFDPWSLEHFQKAVRSPYGMILITGPTGSGKTTTLYSVLQTVNKPDIHILTLEDPVEYNLRRVNQVQVREEIGLTFAAALRAFLRHDPDIILVGEMRDAETSQIAIRAALTGHLVLSTLHTNDCASTIARLIDMGIPPFLVASSLRLVGAQRLIRKVCSDCREAYQAEGQLLTGYGHPGDAGGPVTLYKAQGCPNCNFTGMRGRIAVYEVMPISRELRDLILDNASALEIARVAREQGMKTLREAALQKVLEGVTTLDEVLRVTAD